MAEQQRAEPVPMDIDSDPHAQPATTPATTESMPGAFNGAADVNMNGVNGPAADKKDRDEEAPTPPPHKSTPTSPVAPPAPTPEDAEAFKNAGNTYYKAREYKRAIEEYTKGMPSPTSTMISQTNNNSR
jgi:DnaJ family protein C protein 7